MKPWVLTRAAGAGVAIAARSLVMVPVSMVSSTALSSMRANSVTSGVPSSSPRFAIAPVQAKIVAVELVEVASPRSCLRKWRVTVPCAASNS